MNCCVIGIGLFGKNVATELTKHNISVLAIDKDMNAIEQIQDKVNNAVCIEITDEESMYAAGIDSCETAIVAIGESFEESILITAILKKKLKIPMIVCRAASHLHKDILKLIGANYVILPEREAGRRLADKLSIKYGNFIRITDNYSLTHTHFPQKWSSKTLADLQLEDKYHIKILGKQIGEDIKNIDTNHIIQEDDYFLISGSNEYLEKFVENISKLTYTL